uniref:Uncharacterized protein n=1 Tax=Meloidogyne incognita TaxID=6306 RepID=A0A914M3R2_MELIC
MEKKILDLNSEHKNKIEEIEQKFEKLFENKFKQLKKENDLCLKQKDEKINFLEEEIKKANDLLEKNTEELNDLANNEFAVSMLNLDESENEWSEIEKLF